MIPLKAPQLSLLPARIEALVFDFDGVFTDNKVYIPQEGTETVRCDRSDGLGVELFRAEYPNIPLQVISKERNPVVKVRCDKLKINCLHGIEDKPSILKNWAAEHKLSLSNILYTGNDLNDLECMQLVGCPVAVADAYPEILQVAKIVLHKRGGEGAIRELLDLVHKKLREENYSSTQSTVPPQLPSTDHS